MLVKFHLTTEFIRIKRLMAEIASVIQGVLKGVLKESILNFFFAVKNTCLIWRYSDVPWIKLIRKKRF